MPTKKEPPQWNAEPTSFLGLDFGRKLEEVIPRCQKSYGSGEGYCFERPFEFGGVSYAQLHNGPAIGIGYVATAMLLDGAFEGATITIAHRNGPILLNAFTEKYGAPTSVAQTVFRNQMGAEYPGKIYSWLGQGVQLSFSEYGSKLDDAQATIVTSRLMKANEAKAKAATEAAQKGL